MRRIIPALQLQNAASLDNNNNSNNNIFNSPNSTPTRASRTLRQPLLSKDHNAMMRVAPKSPLQSKSGNGNKNKTMPYNDKQNPTRPFMPTVSSAGLKTINRTPLTPRVAGSTTHPPAVTPNSSRPRADNRTPVGLREDAPTPVSTFLNHNITPRSGSRKSRVDSTNTTPTGTPNGTPAPPSTNEPLRLAHDSPFATGLGIQPYDRDAVKRPAVSFSPAVSDVGSSRGPANSGLGDSKFFFASDAKTAPISRPPLPTSNNSSFLYANGETIPTTQQQSSSASAVGSTVREDTSHPKFFHANGIPDVQSSPSPHFAPPRPSSTVSSSSRMTSPRLAAASPGPLSPNQRPASPSKLNQQSSVLPSRGLPPLNSAALPRPQVAGRGQSTSSIVAARRASIEGTRAISHGRSASIGSTDSKVVATRRISGGSTGDPIAPPSPLTQILQSLPVSTPEEQTEDEGSKDSISEPLSPTKAGNSLERMNELAANARRERKVLDLEITNSSLAAINRTLEREMRKQTAELRRFRRLSRSGRLSIATTTSLRTSSGSLSIGDGLEGTPLSDMSEEEESDEEDSDYSDESFDDRSLSPGAMAESDLRHRKRDEKRLQLDLSKHQQLLVDSQKMNQSLKRCLGCTEDLIKEGQKALAYSVRVSDVELGGRVLSPDEIEDENEGMSDIGAELLKEARIAAANGSPTWTGLGRDDRDSGIELGSTQTESYNISA